MRAKILGVLLLCAILMTAGVSCNGRGPTIDGMTGEDILEAAWAAHDGLETYSFEVSEVVIAVGGGAPTTSNASGIVDKVKREQFTEISVFVPALAVMGMDTLHAKAYIIGDWQYLGIDMNSSGVFEWQKTPATDESWQEGLMAEQQLDLVRGIADAEIAGTETINDIDCYKLNLEVDLSEFIVRSGLDGKLKSAYPDLNLNANDALTNYAFTMWVAKGTFYIVKVEVLLTLTIESDISNTEIVILFFDFNQPVTIELPPEAADATVVTPP